MPIDNPLSTAAFRSRINACREVKKHKLTDWQDSVSYRMGKPFRNRPTEDTVNVPADWSRTKNKTAQLFYQVPEVKLRARQPQYASAAPTFAAALNYQLTNKVRAQYMMNEVLADVINAAGIGICKIGYEGQFEEVEMGPSPDQSQLVPRPAYECYYARRIAPQHFLWPVEFTGSDWNECDWLGWEGYISLAEAKRRGWVGADFKGQEISDQDWRLVRDLNQVGRSNDAYVKFCELFVKATAFDPEEKDPRKIIRIVIVDGLPDDRAMVVKEDFKWQRYNEQTGQWIGLTTFPIKVLTLTYVSDLAIPPSDSEIGRPQVRELIRGRSQMLRQRESSLPLRWFDVNLVDHEIAENLRKGKWQNMIPMRGPGDRAIGEVARAQYPRESFEFDRVAKLDLDEAWSMGQPQQASNTPGDTTATEVREMQNALNVKLDYERAWVLKFFLDVAQGIGSLMQLFSDDVDYAEIVGQDGVRSLMPWDKTMIRGDFIFEAKPDSQLKLDVSQKRAEALNLYKLLRKDPLINPQGLVLEVLQLHGIDPSKGMVPQQPPQPPPPKMSYSFKGEDLMNPIVVAIIQKGPSPLTAQDIAAAKLLIQDAAKLLEVNPPPQGDVVDAESVKRVPTGEQPEHPGPADVVQPLNRRYSEQGSTGPEGSRDSDMKS